MNPSSMLSLHVNPNDSIVRLMIDLVDLVNPYDMYGLAVDSLVSRSGRGPQSLVEYCRLLGEGVSWQLAFEQSFSQTVGDFYAYFESMRPR